MYIYIYRGNIKIDSSWSLLIEPRFTEAKQREDQLREHQLKMQQACWNLKMMVLRYSFSRGWFSGDPCWTLFSLLQPKTRKKGTTRRSGQKSYQRVGEGCFVRQLDVEWLWYFEGSEWDKHILHILHHLHTRDIYSKGLFWNVVDVLHVFLNVWCVTYHTLCKFRIVWKIQKAHCIPHCE